MKQSTFSAVMANSIKNLLQGYTKGIRFVAVLTMLLTMGIGQAWGAEVTATLSFANKAQRTSFSTTKQVWEQNGITFTNNKASSSNAVADYAAPVRLYAGSSVTVACSLGKMTKIVFDCNSSSYATAMKTSIGTVSGATVTVSSDKVTVTFTTAVASFTVAKLTEQVRLDSITVTYNAGWILKGSFDNWGDGVDMNEVSTGKAEATLDLAANTQYEFKFLNGSNWLGNSGTINADISNWVFKTTESSNVKLNSGLGGTFTFTIDYSASTTQPKVTVTYPRKTIYLKPGVWNADGAKYAIYYFINGQDGWSGLMTQGTCDKDVYSATIPQWNGLKMDLVRLNSDATAGDWNKKWNQTNDITINSNDYVTITGWDQANFTYTTYTPPTYTITFSGNGNTGGSMTNVSGIPCEGSTTLATNGYTRTGYTFNNWKTNVAVTANSSSVAANGTVANKATISNITSDITLTAQWKANTYTITYKDGGNTNFSGTHESGYPTTHTYGTATTLKNATKTGYTFDGWYKESACTNKVTSLGANAYTANITLYAKWTPVTYYVKFDGNGSTSGSMSNQTFKYGTAQNLTANAFIRTGYTFAGWTTNDDGSGTSYADKASVNNLSTTNGAIVNLYAKWTKVHTITWKVNGQQYGEKQEVVDGQTIGSLPDAPDAPASCSDKVFMGWTESATVDSDGTGITYISASTKPNSDKTYHAVFATETSEEATTTISKTKTEDFEKQTAGTTYNSTQTYTAANSNAGIAWKIYYGTVSTNAVITGSKSAQMRWYDNTASNLPYIQTTSIVKGLKSISFKALTSDNKYKYSVSYSTDNSTWTNVATSQTVGSTSSAQTKSYTINANGVDAYIKIAITSTTDVSDKATFRIDDVVFTYLESTTTTETKHTDYVTSCIPQHTITLNPNGGTIDDNDWIYDNGTGYYTQTVSEGTVLNFPTATKTGYTNIGWKDNLGDAVTSITVSESATYTAAYDCALATVGISGTYALTVGDVFELVATAYDSNGDVLTCPANTTYSWERYNSVNEKWEAITDDNSDGDDAKLTFNNCQIANCGTYRCHVSYGECEASSHTTAADGGFNVHCFHLKGDFEGDWNIEYAFNHTDEPGIATLTLDLISGHTHNFKIYDGISQYGNGGTISASITGWEYGSDNNSNTILETGADGSYVFTLNYTQLINNSTNILVLDVTYPPSNQSEGYTVYYDNLVHNWTNVYYRIGHNRDNGDGTWGWNQNQKMTKVPGTSHLYTTKTPQFDNFEAWHIANNVSWADKNSIYLVNPDGTEYDITHASVFKKFVVVEDITLTPEATGTFVNDENCTYYADVKQSGMKMHKATVIPVTGGTITVSYTDHDGTAKSDFTSGDRDLAHTCLLTITATPDAGYSLGTLTVNDVPFTSGNVHTLAEDAVIKVVWEEKAIPTFAWSADSYTAALEADNTFPTLSNPNNLDVTYSSSEPDIAKIDKNGNVILGAVGTTMITADGAETATHKSATTTYELTVVESNCRWVEVTDNTTLEDGDEVVIIMVDNKNSISYAMDNKATSKNPLAIETNTDIFSSGDVPNTIIWDIQKDANGIVFYSKEAAGNYIYCITDYIRVGGGSNNTFTIDKGYIQSLSYLTYLAVATGATTKYWRQYSYDSGNITNQTLKFYKRECLDASKVWVEGNLTNVTCSPQLPQQLAKDGSITLTFSPVTAAYTLPTNVSVKMGSTNLTPSWNRTTGELTINAPTGGFTDNVLVTVEALQVKTVTFSVGNGDTAPGEMQAVENTNITLPSLTTNLTCVKFVGWTDAASGYTHGTDKLYKAGDSYTVTENVTLHAVYAAGGGYVLVTDEANLAVDDKVIIVATNSNVAMGADRGNNRGQVEITKVDNTITNIGESQILTLEAGTKSETFAFNTGSGYLYAASSGSNYLKTQATNNDNGSWTIEIHNTGIATIKAQGTYTRNWLRYNDGSDIFSCYASGQSDVSIYKEDVAGYTTDPACVTYKVTTCTSEHGTISVDPTTVDPYGSTTVTFTPDDGYMLQAVTVTSGTAEVGAPSYTTSQISGGTVRITDIQSDIEVCATFVEIPYYKVTFVDMNNGNSTKIVSQSGFGADIQAPTTASDGCDATWTFIGWAPNNSLNGASEIPSGLVAPGGTISGSLITDNSLTYYSVYSNSSDGTPPFSIGKSGTYYFKAITENSDVYYATGEFTGSDRYNTNSTPNIPFLLTYNSTTGKYTIKNTLSNKYLAPDSYDENALTEQDASYGWDVIQPTLYADKGVNAQAKTGEYLFSYTKSDGTSVRYLYCNGSYFDSWTKDNSKYALYLELASEMHYYNASSCTELVTMSFDVPADAELTYENGYPEGYYKDSEKKNVSTFPTLTYEGWTFIGWTAGASYNDQIGDANLDDENSSPNAPSETIYKTGGVSYYLGADVTMYPVFTKFADNEPFDMVNGGDYYIYYIADGEVATSEDEYGASNRIYAGGWGSGGTSDSYGATQSCASATLFTFTKLSNGKWSIYDNTKGRYLCAGATDNNLALNTTTATYGEWTITVHNGNQVNAVSKEGYTLSAYSQDAVTGTFKNYATSNFNHNSAYFHRVYVGTCTERVYSSNPSNKPKITLNGTAAVTSTKDQTIRSAKSLTLSAVKLAANGTITLTSDNADVYFSTDKTANFSKAIKPVASLTINADANGKLALTTVYVHYKPAAVPTSNLDMQTVTITATTGTDGQPNYATATTTATVRNLPADFVIAAKVNDIWYALPNNCNSTSIVNGLPIDVDDPINPTSATFAPAEAKWGLKPVYTTSGANDRYADYGEYFVFAETNTGTAGLLYSNKDNAQVQTQGTYSGISGYQEISRYEWIPTTTDLITYQLAGAQDSKQLNINVNGVFGTHSQLVTENELRLLPIDAIYQHAEVQVVEWRADAVVFMYTGDPNHSVTATLASTSTTKSLSESKIKFDHGVYKMPVSNLLSNAGKTMSIKFHDGSTEVARTEITIPVIINGETNTSSLTVLAKADYETLDVVILNGGKLTATEGDAAKYRFRNVTVYGGGKLVIGEGKYLSMASIILRAGGFANDGTYEYVYPQFELKGNLTNTAGKFYYDYITDYDHWYHLVLPFAGDLGTIKYPTEFYGSNVTTSNSGSWIIKRYAGDIRATGNYKAWVDIETDNPKPTATTPGVGYIFWGAPKKVKVNGVENRQQWGIQRISMTKGAGTAKTEEIGNKKIQGLSSHKDVANNSGKVNDQGWNLIGNPYMVNLTGLNSESLKPGKLVEVEDAAGNWTGQWKDNEDGFRYVTIPSDHFDTYTAQRMTAFTEANPMIAGRAFFIQLEDDDAGVTFSAANRASLLAARVAANEPTTDIETGIVLSNETMQDEVNFWIKDGKTNDYEYNADYPKTPNNTNFNIYGVHTNGDLSWVATGPEYAEESMPIGYQVPAAGTYMLSISEDYYSEDLDALYVTDHALSPEVTVDLMSNSYEFSVNQAETNNERFTVSLKLKSENQGPATGLENIGVQTDGTIKFIYHDKIFILHNGTIYDATGKQVTTINK